MKRFFQKWRERNQREEERKKASRKKIIEEAVDRTVEEYGETLKRLGAE